MRAQMGRALRMWMCRRVLEILRKEASQYDNEWHSTVSPKMAHYYAGRRDGMQHAINLIETEYRR